MITQAMRDQWMATVCAPVVAPVATDPSPDSAEWTALESECERRTNGLYYAKGNQGAPSYRKRAHPQSYGSDLPLWSESESDGWTVKLSKAEKSELAKRQICLIMPRDESDAITRSVNSCGEYAIITAHEKPNLSVTKETKRRLASLIAKVGKRRESVRTRASELSLLLTEV